MKIIVIVDKDTEKYVTSIAVNDDNISDIMSSNDLYSLCERANLKIFNEDSDLDTFISVLHEVLEEIEGE